MRTIHTAYIGQRHPRKRDTLSDREYFFVRVLRGAGCRLWSLKKLIVRNSSMVQVGLYNLHGGRIGKVSPSLVEESKRRRRDSQDEPNEGCCRR